VNSKGRVFVKEEEEGWGRVVLVAWDISLNSRSENLGSVRNHLVLCFFLLVLCLCLLFFIRLSLNSLPLRGSLCGFGFVVSRAPLA
jgi:hypothetical protein